MEDAALARRNGWDDRVLEVDVQTPLRKRDRDAAGLAEHGDAIAVPPQSFEQQKRVEERAPVSVIDGERGERKRDRKQRDEVQRVRRRDELIELVTPWRSQRLGQKRRLSPRPHPGSRI